MNFAANFAPDEALANELLAEISGMTADASHDISHILRVWRNVQVLSASEGGDRTILTAATLLHDCVDVPKNSPDRASASRFAATKASAILLGLGWSQGKVASVAHAIEAHSFSANIAPETLEARILQDADRLDAIGHIGIARCFYVAGRTGQLIYDPEDPDGSNRVLDDAKYAVDHFSAKLLHLAGSFQTATGAGLAAKRHDAVRSFLDGLLTEISGV